MKIIVYAALVGILSLVLSQFGDYLISRHRMRPRVVIGLAVALVMIVAGLGYVAQSKHLRKQVVTVVMAQWPR